MEGTHISVVWNGHEEQSYDVVTGKHPPVNIADMFTNGTLTSPKETNRINSAEKEIIMKSKKLIVYYSMDGNTRQVAEKIHKATGADIVEIDTVIPYTGTDEEIGLMETSEKELSKWIELLK